MKLVLTTLALFVPSMVFAADFTINVQSVSAQKKQVLYYGSTKIAEHQGGVYISNDGYMFYPSVHVISSGEAYVPSLIAHISLSFLSQAYYCYYESTDCSGVCHLGSSNTSALINGKAEPIKSIGFKPGDHSVFLKTEENSTVIQNFNYNSYHDDYSCMSEGPGTMYQVIVPSVVSAPEWANKTNLKIKFE